MDTLTKKQRSYCMSKIRSRNTGTEFLFKSYLKNKGIRGFRFNKNIIGKPDLYFPKEKIAVFIDGCFWHRCKKCFIKPKSNIAFWNKKINGNVIRDKKTTKILRSKNISVLRFWEHQINQNIKLCYNRFNKLYEKKSGNKKQKS